MSVASSRPAASTPRGASDGALTWAALTLARRLAAGGAMWCAAPQQPGLARRAAAELAQVLTLDQGPLQVVAVQSADPVGHLRPRVAEGDVLLVLGTAGDPRLLDLLRRNQAWGATAVWAGWGPAPVDEALAVLVWLEGPSTAHLHEKMSRQVRRLRELTQACLRHPSALDGPAGPCSGPGCMVCADEGRVAELVEVDGSEASARTAWGWERVDISLVPTARRGDMVLVHAGAAICSLAGAGPR